MTRDDLIKSISSENDNSELIEVLLNMPSEILSQLILTYGQPDSVLAHTGDDFKNIYILLDGHISLSYELNTEFTYTFAIIHPVNLLGETETFTNCPYYKATIKCQDSCKYLVIPKAMFISWMKKDNKALLCMTKHIAQKYTEQVRQDRTYLSASGENRFLYLITKYYEAIANNGVCTITTPKELLAEEICVSLKTISRNISALKKEGLLTTKGHNIIINRDQYERILDEYEELFY